MTYVYLATFKSLKRRRYRCNKCGRLFCASELNQHRSKHLPQIHKPRGLGVTTVVPNVHRAQRQLERLIPASSVWRWPG